METVSQLKSEIKNLKVELAKMSSLKQITELKKAIADLNVRNAELCVYLSYRDVTVQGYQDRADLVQAAQDNVNKLVNAIEISL